MQKQPNIQLNFKQQAWWRQYQALGSLFGKIELGSLLHTGDK